MAARSSLSTSSSRSHASTPHPHRPTFRSPAGTPAVPPRARARLPVDGTLLTSTPQTRSRPLPLGQRLSLRRLDGALVRWTRTTRTTYADAAQTRPRGSPSPMPPATRAQPAETPAPPPRTTPPRAPTPPPTTHSAAPPRRPSPAPAAPAPAAAPQAAQPTPRSTATTSAASPSTRSTTTPPSPRPTSNSTRRRKSSARSTI
ncbi:hypothetical protein DFH06DRAFT_1164133 [Mycena polygramma]|nr:hypothetical protein DFH06DRAFT_1164133 [Mycena polygramma]